MPVIHANDGARLYYEERGAGTPILVIGGWCMSTPFWRHQMSNLSHDHRVIALDPRAYGQSEKVTHGHRMSRHARDIYDLLSALDLQAVTAVGWSLAANALLAYYDLFGGTRLKGLVLVDQSPRCLNDDGWTLGSEDLDDAITWCDLVRRDHAVVATDSVRGMFRVPPSPAEEAWMVAEVLKTPAEAAAALGWDHLNQDWRDVLPTVALPVLVAAGRHSTIFPLAASTYLAEQLPQGELHIFEHSGHCPFYEEPHAFNAAVRAFVAAVPDPIGPRA